MGPPCPEWSRREHRRPLLPVVRFVLLAGREGGGGLGGKITRGDPFCKYLSVTFCAAKKNPARGGMGVAGVASGRERPIIFMGQCEVIMSVLAFPVPADRVLTLIRDAASAERVVRRS